MINFDAVDFSEHRSEEVISFFWRSVYLINHLIFKFMQIHMYRGANHYVFPVIIMFFPQDYGITFFSS